MARLQPPPAIRAAGARWLSPGLILLALVVAVIGSLGAPLITGVATEYRVALAGAQWTLTLPLLTGAIATPLLGRLGAGAHRRPAVLGTLIAVTAGSLLTVLWPPGGSVPFGLLLLGRGLQGTGLGLPALMIGIARDQLAGPRASSAIAQISVASIVGIGIGYPVAGLLTDLAGVRAAYGLGLAMTLVALLVGWAVVPASPAGRGGPLDLAGGLWLGTGLLLLLLVISQDRWWRTAPGYSIAGLLLAGAVLGCWVAQARRQRYPLVDLRLLRHRTVLAANAAMLLAGVGMYLLLSLITRYVQSPHSAGYGFGFSTFQAGLVLVPFSALGWLAGRLVSRWQRQLPAAASLLASAVVLLLASSLFALTRSSWYQPVLAMALLGLGVGGFSAAMPAIILRVTSTAETSAAMSINQVVRSVGFSIGSAIGGLVLAASTSSGRQFPAERGYQVAGWIGSAIMLATIVLIALSIVGTRWHPEPD